MWRLDSRWSFIRRLHGIIFIISIQAGEDIAEDIAICLYIFVSPPS